MYFPMRKLNQSALLPWMRLMWDLPKQSLCSKASEALWQRYLLFPASTAGFGFCAYLPLFHSYREASSALLYRLCVNSSMLDGLISFKPYSDFQSWRYSQTGFWSGLPLAVVRFKKYVCTFVGTMNSASKSVSVNDGFRVSPEVPEPATKLHPIGRGFSIDWVT